MPRFHVARSVQINAAPEQVFATVADFGTWTEWSPWLCAEPAAQVTVSENPAAVGSTYAWKGEVVGEGTIEHRQLDPGRLVEEEIRFVKPFRSTSQVKFEMKPVGEATEITWHMHGSLPWFLFWMRSSMEFFIGMDYERGLRMLKEWIETGEVLSQTTVRGVESVGPVRIAGIRQTCPVSEMCSTMEAVIVAVNEQFCEHHLPADGPMASVYHDMNMKSGTFDFTTGYVVPDSVEPIPDGLSCWTAPAGRAFCVQHVGRYEHLGNAWSAAHQHVRYKKLKMSKAGAYEIYENCPDETPPGELFTRVILPLR